MCSEAKSASSGKICVTAEGNTLDSRVDARFGRCRYFLIVDTDTLDFEAIQNPNIESTGGAGIQSAQLVTAMKVKAVVTGNVGPNAFTTLQAAGLGIFTGASGTAREAVEKYKKGEFKAAQSPSVGSKYGMPGKGER